MQLIFELLYAIWNVVLASSGVLLLGLLIAGLLHALLPKSLIEKHLTKPGFVSVLKSSLFGLPLPLCSCSVIPVGASLRRSGASKGATASFFISTPEVGVDSFLLSYSLLGPLVAFSRAIVSLITALIVGNAVDLFVREDSEDKAEPEVSRCCQHKQSIRSSEGEGVVSRIFSYAYFTLLGDLSKPLLIGFLLAGIISVLVPDSFVSDLGLSTVSSMLLMLLFSLPTYVCATSSTPLAAALLAKGVPAEAVLVFLLAGPATNFATIVVLKEELKKLGLAIYLFGIMLVSFVSAYVLGKYLPTELSEQISGAVFHNHEHESSAQVVYAVVFSLLLGLALLRRQFKSQV